MDHTAIDVNPNAIEEVVPRNGEAEGEVGDVVAVPNGEEGEASVVDGEGGETGVVEGEVGEIVVVPNGEEGEASDVEGEGGEGGAVEGEVGEVVDVPNGEEGEAVAVDGEGGEAGAVNGGGEAGELPIVAAAAEGEGVPAANENGANALQVECPHLIFMWIIISGILIFLFPGLVTYIYHKTTIGDIVIFFGTLVGSAITCFFIVPFVVRILLRARLKSRFVFLILIYIFHGWLTHIISDEEILYDVCFDVGTLLVLVAIRLWSKDDEHLISSTIVLQLLSVGIETLHCNSDCKVFKEPEHARHYKVKAGLMIATAILGSIVTVL